MRCSSWPPGKLGPWAAGPGIAGLPIAKCNQIVPYCYRCPVLLVIPYVDGFQVPGVASLSCHRPSWAGACQGGWAIAIRDRTADWRRPPGWRERGCLACEAKAGRSRQPLAGRVTSSPGPTPMVNAPVAAMTAAGAKYCATASARILAVNWPRLIAIRSRSAGQAAVRRPIGWVRRAPRHRQQ